MIVAVDSDFEDVTIACLEYRQDTLFPDWETQGLAVTRLTGQAAQRAAVAGALTAADTLYVTGSGHGFDDFFTGDQLQPVLKIGEYAPMEVRGRIIHLLSCSTAQQLGPDLVANGCLAFFGYDVEFLFPLEQPSLFLDCDAQIDRALTEGKSADEAYQQAIGMFDGRVQALVVAKRPHLAAMLEFNRDHLCAPSIDVKWGHVDAALPPR